MKKLGKKLQNLNYFLIMKFNRPLLYRLLKGFIDEQERNGMKMYSRVTVKDSKIKDLEIKDAVFLEGMMITNSFIGAAKVTESEAVTVSE